MPLELGMKYFVMNYVEKEYRLFVKYDINEKLYNWYNPILRVYKTKNKQ